MVDLVLRFVSCTIISLFVFKRYIDFDLPAMASTLRAMETRIAMASNLLAMASNLEAVLLFLPIVLSGNHFSLPSVLEALVTAWASDVTGSS